MEERGGGSRHLFGDVPDDVLRAIDAAEQAVEAELHVSPGHYYRSSMIGRGSEPAVKMAHVIEVAVRAALEHSASPEDAS